MTKAKICEVLVLRGGRGTIAVVVDLLAPEVHVGSTLHQGEEKWLISGIELRSVSHPVEGDPRLKLVLLGTGKPQVGRCYVTAGNDTYVCDHVANEFTAHYDACPPQLSVVCRVCGRDGYINIDLRQALYD